MDEQPKITLLEGIIAIMVVVVADILEFLVALTGFGIIISIAVNFIVGASIQIWLIFKGVKGFWKQASNGIGAVADGLFAGFLPIKTFTLLFTIYLVNKK